MLQAVLHLQCLVLQCSALCMFIRFLCFRCDSDKRRTLASSFRGPVALYISGTVCNGAIVRTTPLLTVLFVLRLFVDLCQRVCSVRAIPGILCFVSPVGRSVFSPKECIALSRGSFPAISGSLVFASRGRWFVLRPKAIAFVNFFALGHRVGDAQSTPRVWDVMLAYEPGNRTESDLSAQQQFAAEKAAGPGNFSRPGLVHE